MNSTRKLVSIALLGVMVVAGLTAPATAGKRKKPVPTTLYLHGPSALGEVDGVTWLSDGTIAAMDPTAPTDPAPKSWSYVQPTANRSCTGFPLAWPYWRGTLAGQIVGDMKITLHFLSPPASATVRIWTDTPEFLCDDAYVTPIVETTVDIPAGSSKVEVVVPGVKATAGAMISMTVWDGTAARQGRVVYDAVGYDSKIEFGCIPASGASCT